MNIDLAGFPFPIKHSLFNQDVKLIKKINVLGTYVEMNREYRDAFEIVQKLCDDDVEKKFSDFGTLSIRMPDMLLSYSILQYAKPFVESHGSTNLIGKETAISEDKSFHDFHTFVMTLRNKFYAHRELNINRHQLHVLQNFPGDGEIDLITDGQSKVMLVYKSIDLEQFQRNIFTVGQFLNNTITGFKSSIISNLSLEQKEYLLKNDIDLLRSSHTDDGNFGMSAPFRTRIDGKSDNET